MWYKQHFLYKIPIILNHLSSHYAFLCVDKLSRVSPGRPRRKKADAARSNADSLVGGALPSDSIKSYYSKHRAKGQWVAGGITSGWDIKLRSGPLVASVVREGW